MVYNIGIYKISLLSKFNEQTITKEFVRDLTEHSEMIIFFSLLTTFEASSIFNELGATSKNGLRFIKLPK